METKTTIKVKRLYPDAQLPIRGTEHSVGWDVFAHRRIAGDELARLAGTYFNNFVAYGTGLAVEPPPGYFISFRSRSSIFRHGMSLCNGVGTIDWDYRGEMLAIFYRHDAGMVGIYCPGDRIGQIILEMDHRPDIVEVDKLSETARGRGGHGSTGR